MADDRYSNFKEQSPVSKWLTMNTTFVSSEDTYPSDGSTPDIEQGEILNEVQNIPNIIAVSHSIFF